ncbi:UPF0481 protein At3g47200-like [Ziziphus jujuba]|uniref:UPF0481 protein At3g47200-like n=1 Tax=Ziziphus jujuba TaxID=326968 RepID=A0A6P4AXC6_ZIZJJ|nr:UPF0481 protein At3g47200-like [Ziziphus jujuba]
MAAREGGLVLKEEIYAAKRRIIRENPEAPEGSSRQSNDQAEHSIDIKEEVGNNEEFFDSIVNPELDNNNLPWPKIPKVADALRNIESHEGCYDHVVVSIGPYHHEKPHLLVNEKLKLKWAKQFVADMFPDKEQIKMPGLLKEKVNEVYKEVENVEDAARTYYDSDHTKKFSKKEFTEMMFLDGCFILHFIYMHSEKPDEMGMKSLIIALVRQDLFLLENQLPYIVLESLMRKRFEEADTKAKERGTIGKAEAKNKAEVNGINNNYIKKFIEVIRGDQPHTPRLPFHDICCFRNHKRVTVTENNVSVHHLLHLLRENFAGSKKEETVPIKNNCWQSFRSAKELKNAGSKDPFKINSWHSFRSAKELKNAGIKFKPNSNGKFSDVRFESCLWLSGKLILPPLIVDDSTKSMLLNLVAMETCSDHGPEDFWVTSYICLMDLLLDTVEDVIVLRNHNILMNCLGSDQQVADLFNEISKNLVPHPKAYSTIKAGIEAHYKNWCKIWVAEWINTHFSSPWTVLAFLGAILAIVLSFIQTYVAIKPDKNGP